MTSWIDSAHERDLLNVAQSLGMEVREPRGANGGAFGPCPACNAKRRHPTSKDRRLACGVQRDEKGWRCSSVMRQAITSILRVGEGGAALLPICPMRRRHACANGSASIGRASSRSAHQSDAVQPGRQTGRTIIQTTASSKLWTDRVRRRRRSRR